MRRCEPQWCWVRGTAPCPFPGGWRTAGLGRGVQAPGIRARAGNVRRPARNAQQPGKDPVRGLHARRATQLRAPTGPTAVASRKPLKEIAFVHDACAFGHAQPGQVSRSLLRPSSSSTRSLRRGVMLAALFAVVIPQWCMVEIHCLLGLGELPDRPIVGYLARSASALYAARVRIRGRVAGACRSGSSAGRERDGQVPPA